MTCRLLLISGSLRAQSTNTAVLRTARADTADDVSCVLYGALGDLPHFNPDDEADLRHRAVIDLRAQIHDADALVFSTPEYAGALPGSFKNLLDWTIGDDHPGAIHEKPVAWINVSPRGAANAHASLREVLTYAHASIVEAAVAEIPVTGSMVGHDGRIADPAVRAAARHVLTTLAQSVCGDDNRPGARSRD
jgi:NAD(P)H-dependent FMN reductase